MLSPAGSIQHLFNFGSRRNRGVDAQQKHLGLHDKPRLVGRRSAEYAQVTGLCRVDLQPELLLQLTGQRLHGLFMGLDLAARLHEGPGAALAHQQGSTIRPEQQGGGDADERSGHG